jgi:DNA-binding NarL/FixJ family response regulator
MAEQTTRRIMVIDDNPFSRQLLRKLFESNGCKIVASARGTKEAVELYPNAKPDFVTLDIVMDNENGFRTLIALRRLDPNVKVIIVSSDSHQATIEQAQNLGVAAYVVKPATWISLSEAMQKAGEK